MGSTRYVTRYIALGRVTRVVFAGNIAAFGDASIAVINHVAFVCGDHHHIVVRGKGSDQRVHLVLHPPRQITPDGLRYGGNGGVEVEVGEGAWAPFVIGPKAIQGTGDGLRARPVRAHAQGHAGVGAGGHGAARHRPGMGSGAQPAQCRARLLVTGEAAQEGATVVAGAGRRDCVGAWHSGRATAGRKRGERRAPQRGSRAWRARPRSEAGRGSGVVARDERQRCEAAARPRLGSAAADAMRGDGAGQRGEDGAHGAVQGSGQWCSWWGTGTTAST
nr:glycine-rich protein 1-like [Aegilops tauschii subsp. strangulata]